MRVLWCCRQFQPASLALVEASLLVKDNKLAAADAVLSGVQSDSPVIQLQAVLMRAQMAVTNGNQAQVTITMITVVAVVIVTTIIRITINHK